MSGPRKVLQSIFGSGSDPTGPMSRSGVASGGTARRDTPPYPDKVSYLVAPLAKDALGQVPWAVQGPLLEAKQQGCKQAELARSETERYAAKASELTDQADDQTRVRDRLHEGWAEAKGQFEFAAQVLSQFVLHHGRAWLWVYALVWCGLILGDIAGGTLVLIKVGEYPMLAVVLCTAIGVAAVTSARLAEDFRRRLLWLRVKDHLPKDEGAEKLVTSVFTYGDDPYRFLTKIAALIAVTAACLVVGTFAARLAVDSVFLAVTFGLWAAGICGGSFVNSWWHTDPAHTTLRVYAENEKAQRAKRDCAPTDAIAQRAANQRVIPERLFAHRAAARALWYTKLAEAADILARNPQLAGHGTDGLSILFKIHPEFEDEFELLFDQFQVPRYYESRPWSMPDRPTVESGGSGADSTDEDPGKGIAPLVAVALDRDTAPQTKGPSETVDVPLPDDTEVEDDLDETGS